MHTLLNLLFGILAGFLTDYILARCNVTDPIKVIIAVIVGLLVFLANLASNVT